MLCAAYAKLKPRMPYCKACRNRVLKANSKLSTEGIFVRELFGKVWHIFLFWLVFFSASLLLDFFIFCSYWYAFLLLSFLSHFLLFSFSPYLLIELLFCFGFSAFLFLCFSPFLPSYHIKTTQTQKTSVHWLSRIRDVSTFPLTLVVHLWRLSMFQSA